MTVTCTFFSICIQLECNIHVTCTSFPVGKPVEKAKLKGYLKKWRDSKTILGCVLFHDLLKPTSILCKSLQDSELCVTDAIESLLHTSNALEKLKEKKFADYPTVQKVIASITKENDGTATTTYQYHGATIIKYGEAIKYLEDNSGKWCESIVTCIKKNV